MKAEDVIQKGNLWIGNGLNGGLISSFTKVEDNQYCSLDCTIDYDVENGQWLYRFAENEAFEKEGFEHAKEKMIQLLKEEVREKQTQREDLIKRLVTELSFSNAYELKMGIRSLYGKNKLYFREAKIGKEEVFMCLYLNEKCERSTLKIRTKKEIVFKFQWDFAKKYFKGMKEFDQFLLTKSKDRLRLMF